VSIDTTAADKAALDAETALQAAQAAKDGAEVAFLNTVTHLKQITENRTTFEANRLKSRYIGVFGYDRWVKLTANSR
jgi:hypothetical protein